MLEGLVDVCLEGTLMVLSDKSPKQRIEIISLSLKEAIIRIAVSPSLGEKIQCVFQSDPCIKLEAKTSRFIDWKGNPKLAVIEFLDPDSETKRKLQEVVDYYLQLRRAGVQLGEPLPREGKLL